VHSAIGRRGARYAVRGMRRNQVGERRGVFSVRYCYCAGRGCDKPMSVYGWVFSVRLRTSVPCRARTYKLSVQSRYARLLSATLCIGHITERTGTTVFPERSAGGRAFLIQ
jgi:hypothetical protein